MVKINLKYLVNQLNQLKKRAESIQPYKFD